MEGFYIPNLADPRLEVGTPLHPNLKHAGGKNQWKNQVRYLEKEGFSTETSEMSSQENGKCAWAEAISTDTDEDFHGTLSPKNPKDYLKSWPSRRTPKARTDPGPKTPTTPPHTPSTTSLIPPEP